MQSQPQFAGDDIETRVNNMRAYFEHKFIENYDKWHNILLAINEHMGQHLERNGIDPSVAEEFTYDEFCATYIDYVGRFMAQNGGKYTDEMINHIVSCMVAERIPTSVATELLQRAQREQDELQMEYGTPENSDGDHAEIEAHEMAADSVPDKAPPGSQYIPEIWRVTLGASADAFDGWTEVPGGDEPPL